MGAAGWPFCLGGCIIELSMSSSVSAGQNDQRLDALKQCMFLHSTYGAVCREHLDMKCMCKKDVIQGKIVHPEAI